MPPDPPGPRLLSAAMATFLGLALVLIGAGAAPAAPPVNVSGPITDRSGVLGVRAADVRAALDGLFDSTGQQLFVVYVDSFDGLSGQEWADTSARTSDLGDDDILLAVATQDRAYGFSVTDANELSDNDLDRVASDDLLPELRDKNWSGAAIAAARGYDEALNPGAPWGLIGLGGVAVVGAGAAVGVRARRRHRANQPDEHLSQRAGSALVALDDGLRSADQELAYAEAQFGLEATTPFTAALAQARAEAASAFELRQRLDDSEPESGPEHDRLCQQIVEICASADAILDEQVQAFAQLRDLHAKAPEALASVAERAREITDRLPPSRAVLAGLLAKHPITTLDSVAHNVDQAEQLASNALEQTRLGTAAIAADDRPTAVVHVRSAEDAVARAVTLLDSLDRADADLASAPALIADRLSSLGADLVEAAELAPADSTVETATTAARQAMTAARGRDIDPLAAVRDLQAAEATLDELLAAPRADAQQAEKERVALTGAFASARTRIAAVNDYIDARRGSVGPDARTRLAEASRQLQVAADQQTTDPTTALAALARVEDLVEQAERLARADVAQLDRDARPDDAGGVLGGLLGGSSGWSGRSSTSSRSRSSSRSGRGSSRRSSSRRASSRRSSSRRGGGGRF